VNDEAVAAATPYCYCTNTVETRDDGRYCADPFLEPVGTGECNFYDLRNRRDSALERMEDTLDFIDDVRGWNRFASEW
jgi:hypothetical protein